MGGGYRRLILNKGHSKKLDLKCSSVISTISWGAKVFLGNSSRGGGGGGSRRSFLNSRGGVVGEVFSFLNSRGGSRRKISHLSM